MLSPKHGSSSAVKLSKIVHSPNVLVQNQAPPKDSVLDQVLKTIELQLQHRRLLPAFDPDEFHPVWFLAETERNVFLWRNGLSVAQHDEFEFWLNPRALIEKRLGQLERAASDNPFANPSWGSDLAEPAPRSAERAYLQTFAALLDRIDAHTHALSLVASLLRKESGLAPSERVLLPLRRRTPASE